MSSVNREAYVLTWEGNFYTGKTNSGKPEYSVRLSDAQGYSSAGVADNFKRMLWRLGENNLVIRSINLGVVVDV